MDFLSAEKPPPAPNEPPPSNAASPETRSLEGNDQERDVWWGAYAGRTMVPSFLLGVLLTLLIAGGAVFLWLRYGLAPLPVRYSAYALISSVWLCQLIRWGYRIAVLTYRLTTRRLFLEWSFFHRPVVVIDLRHISQVVVERTVWDRWTGVGRVRIVTSDHSVVLEGVRQPEHVAAMIRVWMGQVQKPSGG
jgi:hypothetical protein